MEPEGTFCMKRVATSIRCVPRFGYANTEVRMLDVGISADAEEADTREALMAWFSAHGIADAVYDVQFGDDGLMAIINDEAFDADWGNPLL